jgi:hypothetical protein
MNKEETLKKLMEEWGDYSSDRGAPIVVFMIDPEIPSWHRLARRAYTKRFNNFKLVVAIEQNKALIEPVREVKVGSVYRPLWIYMHHCLPDYPGKEEKALELRALNDLNAMRMQTHDLILDKLNSDPSLDLVYSGLLLDDGRFFEFAREWFGRDFGNRAI